MFTELFAILTALLRGISSISVKKGLRDSNPNTSILVSLSVQTFLLWIPTIFLSRSNLSIEGIEYFIAAGILSPGFAGLCMSIGFDRLGVGVTAPLSKISTLIAVFGAIFFLGEKVPSFVMLGTVFVVVGVFALTWRGKRGARVRTLNLLFPFAAAFMYGFAIDLRKMGLKVGGNPILGATVTSSVSLITILIYLILTKKPHSLNFDKKSVKFFSFSGFTDALSLQLFFIALTSGDVNFVQPIAGSTPLFAVLFSHLFLKGEEKITSKIVLGGILVVVGITLVSL